MFWVLCIKIFQDPEFLPINFLYVQSIFLLSFCARVRYRNELFIPSLASYCHSFDFQNNNDFWPVFHLLNFTAVSDMWNPNMMNLIRWTRHFKLVFEFNFTTFTPIELLKTIFTTKKNIFNSQISQKYHSGVHFYNKDQNKWKWFLNLYFKREFVLWKLIIEDENSVLNFWLLIVGFDLDMLKG